ncbi:hypothetical protein PFISCL1PPCAC_18588, partial [Pristionchus fissidentatus]
YSNNGRELTNFTWFCKDGEYCCGWTCCSDYGLLEYIVLTIFLAFFYASMVFMLLLLVVPFILLIGILLMEGFEMAQRFWKRIKQSMKMWVGSMRAA